MKKAKNILFIALLSLLGTSCGSNSYFKESLFDPSSTSLEELSYLQSDSLSETSSFIWNEGIDLIVKDVLGSYASSLPCLTSDSYEAHSFERNNTQYLQVDAFSENYSTSDKTYSVVLRMNNYQVSFNSEGGFYNAAVRVSMTHLLFVQYQVNPEKKCLTIMAYLYQDKVTSWPTEAVKSVLDDQDIPHFNAPYYQYEINEYKTGSYLIAIACYVDDAKCADNYLKILSTNGYDTSQYAYTQYCTNKTIAVSFYYDIDKQYFLLQAYLL
jgi:hypothetical protein